MSEPISLRARQVWAINESAELLGLAVQVGGIGIFESDLEGRQTHFSPELCTILGLPVGTEMSYEEASRLVAHSPLTMKMLIQETVPCRAYRS
jgi:PAS domain-containing protein